eukprot:8786452-Heterocapsa_arctica.AAC.1
MWVKQLSQHCDHTNSAGRYWHLASLYMGDESKHWSRVKGPPSGPIATLPDIGWDPFSPSLWTDTRGNRGQEDGNDLSGR